MICFQSAEVASPLNGFFESTIDVTTEGQVAGAIARLHGVEPGAAPHLELALRTPQGETIPLSFEERAEGPLREARLEEEVFGAVAYGPWTLIAEGPPQETEEPVRWELMLVLIVEDSAPEPWQTYRAVLAPESGFSPHQPATLPDLDDPESISLWWTGDELRGFGLRPAGESAAFAEATLTVVPGEVLVLEAGGHPRCRRVRLRVDDEFEPGGPLPLTWWTDPPPGDDDLPEEGPSRRLRWFRSRHSIPVENLIAAQQHVREMPGDQDAEPAGGDGPAPPEPGPGGPAPPEGPAIATGPWYPLGPRNINGRVKDLAIGTDRTGTVVLYAATASGGIWKSEDRGESWYALTDNLESLNHGAVATAPEDAGIVFAATGEFTGGGSEYGPTYPGSGIFGSTDGGSSWRQVTPAWRAKGDPDARVSSRCSRLVVGRKGIHPDGRRALYVGGNRGLHVSTDSGATWNRVRREPVSDLVIDANETAKDRVYAFLSYVGVVVTEDGGRTFSKPRKPPSLTGEGLRWARLAIGSKGAHGSRFLALMTTGKWRIFTSVDAGLKWKELPRGDIGYTVPWLSLISVHPADESIIFAGGRSLQRLDAQGRWREISRSDVHDDQQRIVYDPTSSKIVFLANDGGIYRSEDAGRAWSKCSHGLMITQFYDLGATPQYTSLAGGGAQDTGTSRTLGGLSWRSLLGGDGCYFAVDPTDGRRIYLSWQDLNLYRSDEGGERREPIREGIFPFDNRPFITKFLLQPDRPETLFIATERLYRSANRGENWSPLSAGIHADLASSCIGSDSRVGIDPSSSAAPALGAWNPVSVSLAQPGKVSTLASSLVQPYRLHDGARLTLRVGRQSESVLFNKNDFRDIGKATAAEVVRVLRRELQSASASEHRATHVEVETLAGELSFTIWGRDLVFETACVDSARSRARLRSEQTAPFKIGSSIRMLLHYTDISGQTTKTEVRIAASPAKSAPDLAREINNQLGSIPVRARAVERVWFELETGSPNRTLAVDPSSPAGGPLGFGLAEPGSRLSSARAVFFKKAPYALSEGDTLTVSLDGEAPQTITFTRSAGIRDLGRASAAEVAQVVRKQLRGRGSSWPTFSYSLAIEDFALSRSSPVNVYLVERRDPYGKREARLWRSKDGGQSFQEVAMTVPLPRHRPVLRLFIDRFDSDRLIAGLGSLPLPSAAAPPGDGYLMRSIDGGKSWADISGTGARSLPAVPVLAIEQDPRSAQVLYVGTAVGAFRTTDGAKSWHRLSRGLPNVIVQDLVLDVGQYTLKAATHGRSMYEMRLAPPHPDRLLYLRDSAVDPGYLRPSPSGVEDPSRPKGRTYWYQSPDIKVDSPAGGFYLHGGGLRTVFDGVEFDLELQHESFERGRKNWVYAQLHNRGPAPASDVVVKLLWCTSAAGASRLPADLWDRWPQKPTKPSRWQEVGTQAIPRVEAARPVVMQFAWTPPADAGSHCCLLLVAQERGLPPVDRKSLNAHIAVRWNANVTQKNVHAVKFKAPPPPPEPPPAPPEPYLRQLVTLECHNPADTPQIYDLLVERESLAHDGFLSLMLPDHVRTLRPIEEAVLGGGLEEVDAENPPFVVYEDAQPWSETLNPNRWWVVKDERLVVEGVVLEAEEFLPCGVVVAPPDGAAPPRTFTFSVNQREHGGEIIGGSLYEVRLEPR